MEYKFTHLNKIHSVQFEKKDSIVKMVVDGKATYEVVDYLAQENAISFKLNDKTYTVNVAQDKDRTYVAIDGQYFTFEPEKQKTFSRQGAGGQAGNSVVAPMPGLVVKVPVSLGDKVIAGTTLAIVEAMKMQHELRAPCDGLVKKINFKEGDQVDALQVIVELETCGLINSQ